MTLAWTESYEYLKTPLKFCIFDETLKVVLNVLSWTMAMEVGVISKAEIEMFYQKLPVLIKTSKMSKLKAQTVSQLNTWT